VGKRKGSGIVALISQCSMFNKKPHKSGAFNIDFKNGLSN